MSPLVLQLGTSIARQNSPETFFTTALGEQPYKNTNPVLAKCLSLLQLITNSWMCITEEQWTFHQRQEVCSHTICFSPLFLKHVSPKGSVQLYAVDLWSVASSVHLARRARWVSLDSEYECQQIWYKRYPIRRLSVVLITSCQLLLLLSKAWPGSNVLPSGSGSGTDLYWAHVER